MDLISLKYIGGRPNSREIWDRKRYVFNKENDFTCDCPQKLINWLAQYAQGQYQVLQNKVVIKDVIREVEVAPSLKCDKCDFVGKSEHGLFIHKTSKHKKEDK